MAKPKLLVIVGPTASGKSDLAVFLARKLGGEIVSADSRQVYTGLDIGSGKVTKKEMTDIPHHLLDVASPKTIFTVADFKKLADAAISDIGNRSKLPLLCGGTGFYVRSVVDDLLLPEVKPDTVLRKKLDTEPPEKLFALLKKLDPRRAKTIDPHNPRRLIRAIEIALALSRVPKLKKCERFDTLILGVSVPPETLRAKIATRLRARLKTGMVAEVRRLHDRGLTWKRMESLGLEYRYLARYLQKKISKTEMIDQLEQEIISYAKRQMTWFRKDPRIIWVIPNEREPIARQVQAWLAEDERRHTPNRVPLGRYRAQHSR